MIIGATIWFFAVLAGFLFFHYRRWLKSRVINHKRTTMIRAVLLIPSTVWFTLSHPGQVFWTAVLSIAMQGFVFLFAFNGLYNRLRGFDWWFEGGNNDPTEKDNSLIDEFLAKIGRFWTQVIVITGMIVSVGIYILTYFKL